MSAGTVSTKLLCSTSRILPRSERTLPSSLLNTRPRNATAARDSKHDDTTRAMVRYHVAPSMHAQTQHTVCRSCQHTGWWRGVTNTPWSVEYCYTRRLSDKDARHKRRNGRGSGHSPINGVKGMPPSNEQLNGQHVHTTVRSNAAKHKAIETTTHQWRSLMMHRCGGARRL